MYSRANVKAALANSLSNDPPTSKAVYPIQELLYPDEARLWQASFNKPCVPESDAIGLCLVASNAQSLRFRSVVTWNLELKPNSDVAEYVLKPKGGARVSDLYYDLPLLTSWGETGARRVEVTYHRSDPSRLTVAAYTHPKLRGTTNPAHALKWRIPVLAFLDIPWYCICDEVTGIAVIAMRSGKIWILDAVAPLETLRGRFSLLLHL